MLPNSPIQLPDHDEPTPLPSQKPNTLHHALSNTTPSSAPPTSPRPLNNPPNLDLTFRHSPPHLTRKHIPKRRKRLTPSLQVLIAPLDQLDKLSRIDIRVPGAVDVGEDFGRDVDGVEGGVGVSRGGCGGEVGEG